MGGAGLVARAGVRRRWASLAVVAVIAGLAGGVALAAVAGSRRTTASWGRLAAATGWPDVVLFPLEPGEPPAEAVEAALADPRLASVGFVDPFVVAPAGHHASMILLVPDAATGIQARYLRGRAPEGADEIAVNEALAERLGAYPGMPIVLEGATQDEVDACLLTSSGCGRIAPSVSALAVITGVYRTPEEFDGDAFQVDGMLAGPAWAQAHRGQFAQPSWSRRWVVARLRDGVDGDALVTELSDRWYVDFQKASEAAVNGALRVQRTALWVLAAVIAVAGTLAFGQALSRHLWSLRRDQATLAALGMTRADRTGVGVLTGFVAAVAGTALALVGAVAISPLFPLGLARRIDPDVGLHADWAVLATGAGAVFVVLLAVAALAARRASGLAGERPGPASPSPASRLAGSLGTWPVPATGVRFAFEADQGRTGLSPVATVLGAVVGVALIVASFTFAASADRLLTTPRLGGQPFDLLVSIIGPPEGLGPTLEALEGDPRVADIGVMVDGEVILTRPGEEPTDEQTNAVWLAGRRGTFEPVVLEGRPPRAPDEVVLGTGTLRQLDLGVGDTVDVHRVDGSAPPVPARIVGRGPLPILANDEVHYGAAFTNEGFARAAATDGEGGESAAIVRVAGGTSAADLADELSRGGLQAEVAPTTAEVRQLDGIGAVPIAVALLAGALAAVAIAHALVTAVRRRRRELAVLRSLGLRPAQAGGVVCWQSAALVVAALLGGIPAGVVAGRVLWQVVADSLIVVPAAVVPWPAILGVTGVALLLSVSIAVWPARRAGRLRPATVLRAE